MNKSFYITQDELTLKFSHGEGARKLSFEKSGLAPDEWRIQAKQKLTELLGLEFPISAGKVKALRNTTVGNVTTTALTMAISNDFSIPAYLLTPTWPASPKNVVIAIHGHGEVEPCIGAYDDYHHKFALELAHNGHIVLCPELRGFGTLKDVACQGEGTRLDYWNWGQHTAYSLVSDGILHNKPLIGATVEDLLRWEAWLTNEKNIQSVAVAPSVDVVGISYGGDLALLYPVFSERVSSIFASGTLGSFSVIFSRCYNAPAHGIPGILQWMDRSDIAGLNAPRPIAIHYGELDTPGPQNFSASYNETVPQSLKELKAIYRAFGTEHKVQRIVSKDKKHEMDNQVLEIFLRGFKK